MVALSPVAWNAADFPSDTGYISLRFAADSDGILCIAIPRADPATTPAPTPATDQAAQPYEATTQTQPLLTIGIEQETLVMRAAIPGNPIVLDMEDTAGIIGHNGSAISPAPASYPYSTISLTAATPAFPTPTNTTASPSPLSSRQLPTSLAPTALATPTAQTAAPHTLAVTFGDFGTRVYLNGYQCFSCATNLCPAALAEAGTFEFPSQATLAFQMRPHTPSAEDIATSVPLPQPDVIFAASYVAQRDIATIARYGEGSIFTRFRVRGPLQYGTLYAAADEQGTELIAVYIDETGITLTTADPNTTASTVGTGTAITTPHAHSTTTHAPGSWDDGGWHDLVIRAARGAIDLYMDGNCELHQPGQTFFADYPRFARFSIGENARGVRLMGEVRSGGIFSHALTDGEIKRLSHATPLTTTALFDAGYEGSASYRIPSLVTTPAGTVIAGADQRVFISNDAPNTINFVIRRSLDGGATWLPLQKVLAFLSTGIDGASAIDACMVCDRETGRVTVLIDHYPGGIGLVNNSTDIGVTPEGKLYLYDFRGADGNGKDSENSEVSAHSEHAAYGSTHSSRGATGENSSRERTAYILQPDGSVTEAETGVLTDYHVAEDGTVTLANATVTLASTTVTLASTTVTLANATTAETAPSEKSGTAGTAAGNIYFKRGADPHETLLEARTGFLLEMHSDDEGATWSRPRQLNHLLKEPWMHFIGTCPGNGIQLHGERHRGRLLIPYYFTGASMGHYSSGALISDDHGETWRRGEALYEGKTVNGARIDTAAFWDDDASTSESALVEREDGTVVCFSRNQNRSGRIAKAISTDGGESWDSVEYDPQIPDIFSQPNAITLPQQSPVQASAQTENHDRTPPPANRDLSPASDRMVFANASQMMPYRGHGVLRLSRDGGRTWPVSRCFNPYHYVYQCMAVLPDTSSLGLLWERETAGVYFTRIPFGWLEEPAAAGANPVSAQPPAAATTLSSPTPTSFESERSNAEE